MNKISRRGLYEPISLYFSLILVSISRNLDSLLICVFFFPVYCVSAIIVFPLFFFLQVTVYECLQGGVIAILQSYIDEDVSYSCHREKISDCFLFIKYP